MGQINLRNVRKAFGSTEIIPGLDLDIDDGEFVRLRRPLGLRQVHAAAADRRARGRDLGVISIDGAGRHTHAAGQARPRHGVPVLCALPAHDGTQEHRLPPEDGRRAKGGNRAQGRSRRAGPQPLQLSRAQAGQLSGGQRQRVAIGRAIVREPKAFLFDEPLSNLDAALRVNMRLEISELHQQLKTTMIYVTHDQVEAMTMADKIVVLNAGVIEQVGSRSSSTNPANRFVAGFIGSPKMNFIEGPEAAKRGAAAVGVRPEHLAVSREAGLWRGKVIVASISVRTPSCTSPWTGSAR
jgi:multiple sugar transport system ATP-binding protein